MSVRSSDEMVTEAVTKPVRCSPESTETRLDTVLTRLSTEVTASERVCSSPLVAASEARRLTEVILASKTALTDTNCAETTFPIEVAAKLATAAALLPEIRASPET